MNKYLKISALSFMFIASMVVTNTMRAAECGVCKFANGACTIDLRPGQGDGTLCVCKSGSTCSAAGEGCGCKEAPKPEVTNTETTTPVDNAGENTNNPAVNTTDNTPVVNADGTVTTPKTTKENSSVTLVLIIVGVVVLAGGTFGVIKFMGSKNK